MKSDQVYLQHILDAIVKILGYAQVGLDTFLDESHWQDAIIRQLEVIGEAAKQVSTQTRMRYPDIPWKRIAGMRDVLIHNYMGVDLGAVWTVTQNEIPALETKIRHILQTP